MHEGSQKKNAMRRRKFMQTVFSGACVLLFPVGDTQAGPLQRQHWRRRRRRIRRRVRRRIAWRLINGTRFVVVPVDIIAGDELIMEDNSVATITAVTEKNITIVINKKEEIVPAVFEGTVEVEGK